MKDTDQGQQSFWYGAKASWGHAWQFVMGNLWFIGLVLVYLAMRIGLNMVQGARFVTALRSGLIGLAFYFIAILLVDWLFYWRKGCWQDVSIVGSRWQQKDPRTLIIFFVLWVFWLLEIIDRYQRSGALPGNPLLQLIPFWERYVLWLQETAFRLTTAIPVIPEISWFMLIHNLLAHILLPLIILGLLGYRWRDAGLHFKNVVVAAPFYLILIGVLISGGEFERRLPMFAVGLIYPALTEELMYRGWLQRNLHAFLGPVGAVLISAVFFALLHIPGYYSEYTGFNIYQTILGVFDVFVAGLFFGYVFRRTGSVWHNAFLHGMTNIML